MVKRMAEQGQMKRGRPTKPSPEGFDECFRLQAYCADTIASKRSFVRAFRIFLTSRGIEWKAAMPVHFLDYAEKLADHDIPYQAVINNITTNKQITSWYSNNPTTFLVN